MKQWTAGLRMVDCDCLCVCVCVFLLSGHGEREIGGSRILIHINLSFEAFVLFAQAPDEGN